MANLLHKAQKIIINPGITLKQQVFHGNAPIRYTGVKVLQMAPASEYEDDLRKREVCVVALTGQINVTDFKTTFERIGTRESVFDKVPTDSVYISNDQTFKVTAVSQATVVLCYAPSKKQLPTHLIPAHANSIEQRGKYQNQRLVHTILADDDSYANSLLVVEVFTDQGNWSSYPPHKHDVDNLPYESFLEELYYHELNPRQGVVFQRVYTEDRLLDETMAVENGDVVVVPRGYHPVSVPDGYDGYYLNIMAGPTRKWQFHNETAHEWILDRL